MPGIINYGTFVLSFIFMLIIPGPGNLILITSTSKGGPRSGLLSLFGIIFGDQVLLWLAIAGVAALLESSPHVFQAIKWLGAAYLLWLGVQLLMKSRASAPPPPVTRKRTPFLQGVVITLTNPKPILFYVMFLPLFIDPVHSQGLLTFATLAGTAAVLTLLYGAIMIALTSSLAETVKARPGMIFLLEKTAGLFLTIFAIKLAFFN
ncbi:MAG: LysE family transporter [Ewingella sp.]|nr:LysE family transporter [Ewingella sp.]